LLHDSQGSPGLESTAVQSQQQQQQQQQCAKMLLPSAPVLWPAFIEVHSRLMFGAAFTASAWACPNPVVSIKDMQHCVVHTGGCTAECSLDQDERL